MQRPTHGGNLDWAAWIAGCPVSSLLDFSASINPLGPPASAIAAIEAGISTLTAYPDPNYSQLRSALAQEHGIAPDWILPGNGSAELLTWAARELAQQPATYLLVPAFNDYWRALKAFAAEVRASPLNLDTSEWHLNLTDGSQKPKSLGLLLNNPHNPTGKLFSREEILPYLEEFALVVVDEAFMDFLPPQQQQSLIALVPDYPNLAVLRSLTKFYSLPGLRLGYAIAHPERLRRWQQWRDPWCVNALAVAAAGAVLQDRKFQQQTWDWLPPAREKLRAGLAALPGLQPLASAANFLLVRSDFSSTQLQEKLLLRHRILIRDCLSFPELGDAYFRIAVRTDADNLRLLEGLSNAKSDGLA